MLEVLYNTATNKVKAWCADEKQFGNFKPKEGQEVVILQCSLPAFKSDIYYVDLEKQEVIGNPNYVPPIPPRDFATEIDDLVDRVKRIEGGLEYKEVIR